MVTDPGSPLHEEAKSAGYEVVLADPNVGGRYSALSAFGITPSFLVGADVERLLADARILAGELAADDNPGIVLGRALGGHALAGRDKLVLADAGSGIVGFGDWAEQLIAESTGKQGKGILPVVVEGIDAPGFVDIGPDAHRVILGAGRPGVDATAVNGSLGAQMLLWEYATAVAGVVLDINPFDQPNVAESKENTQAILDEAGDGPLPTGEPALVDGAVEVHGDLDALGGPTDLAGVLRGVAGLVPDRGYLAVMAYLDRGGEGAAAGLRPRLARVAGERPVTFGWGPRFLHSTGQLHKGGPSVGVFLQVTGAVARDVDVPGRPFSFGRLELAQALGDDRALSGRGRPVVRLHLTDRAEGVRQLLAAASQAAGQVILDPPQGGNPLRDVRDRRLPRVPGPCALVVFGVTGDLATKKLIPAVYDLANRGLLPPAFAMIGFARRDWGDGDFAALARKAAEAGSRTGFREDVWARLESSIRFVPGSFDDDEAFDRLAESLVEMEESQGIQGNAAFYLSIPPAMFPTVLKQMARTRMADNSERGGWRRVVVEKPFGSDLQSARELNALVDSVFTPQDVFRIDHYLGKETVQNLLALRFANTMFEPVWNGNFVDSVQITMAEDVGIGGRAAFYDSAGAARDVLQNHVLQLVALTAMEEPVAFDAEQIRNEKTKVLGAISLPDNLEHYAVRGQYTEGWLGGQRVAAYTDEEKVPRNSTTETFAAVRLGVETRRWAGVPFYLRTGKRLPRRVTEIAVIFKKAPHLPFSATDTEELGNNQLVVRVQPDEGITMRFGSKVPGSAMEVRDVSMDFLYGESFTESSPEAYERLLLDVLIGDATLFPRNEEVELSWMVIDPLEEYWADTKPEPYRAGEWGPHGADEMLERDGRVWRRP